MKQRSVENNTNTMAYKFKILIPARGGSKRIPKKNIIDINGQPLISYSIRQALLLTDDVYVSTDNDEIAQISKKYGAKVINRPKSISGDHSKSEEVVFHFLDTVKDVDTFVLLQATTPLVRYDQIFDGIKLMDECDSVISVCEERSYYWKKVGIADNYDGTPVNFTPGNRHRTQDMLPWYKENGAFYITNKENFITSGLLYSGKVGFIQMDKTQSVDLDTKTDLILLKKLLTE